VGEATAKLNRDAAVDLNGAGTPVPIGNQVYTLVPQKLGRLRSQLPIQFRSLESLADLEVSSFDGFVGQSLERAHGILKVFIPDLMPVHEFCGFSTEQAYEANEYHEESDHGPDLPQIRFAFEEAMRVNALDLFKHLKNVFGPDLLRAVLQEQVLTRVAASPTQTSTSTSSTSGPDTESMTSGTTPPTESASSD
jgi:hypothetical protein